MIDIFTINRILVILIDIIAVWLGIWVYMDNPRQRLNRIFAAMIFFMLMWVNFAFFARFIYFGGLIGESQFYLSSALLKVAWFATPLFFSFLYLLIVNLINKDAECRPLSRAVLVLGIIASFVAGLTDLVVEGVKFGDTYLAIIYGYAMLPFLAAISFIIAATLYPLLKVYAGSSEKEKNKLGYFLVGILIFYLTNIVFNIIFPVLSGFSRYYFIGAYSSIILVIFTAYAILKKELFNIKIVLTTILVSFIAIILAVDIFIFTSLFILQFFKAIALIIFLFLGRDLVKNALEEAERLKKLEKLNNDLERANKYFGEVISMKNSFLHIVSHQLRTPLAAMRGFVSMWREGDFDSCSPQKMAEIRNRIAGNTERLNNIVNDMVTAMESEEDSKNIFAPTDIEKIIKDNMEMLWSNYEKRELYLKYEKMVENPPKIEADARLLSHVFMNLIDNAEKYTLEGGLKIEVGQEGENLIVKFIDTGVGITKEDKKILFKKFSRGKKSSYINPDGSGLGLFIIKQIIKKHNGKIEFESEGEGKGTTFIVELPVSQPMIKEKEKTVPALPVKSYLEEKGKMDNKQ